ncbi:MAG TPA: hypothetical protein VEV83_08200 [Parafilimonas sp.]|nr:hypothetical protein [Parafilimonas sp.]
MESVNAHLALIKEKFQNLSGKIQELYDTDPDFQSLCADYFLCMKFLNRHEKQSGLLQEYVELSQVLETDIYMFVSQAY